MSNLVEKQNVLGNFVKDNVIADVTSVVEYILTTSSVYGHVESPFTYDDVENYYIDNSEKILEIQDILDEIDTLECLLEDNKISEEEKARLEELRKKVECENLENRIEELRDENDSYADVLEWWQVSPMLLEKLKDKGEVVISSFNYWGRCTSGQAILLDEVIEEIAEDIKLI